MIEILQQFFSNFYFELKLRKLITNLKYVYFIQWVFISFFLPKIFLPKIQSYKLYITEQQNKFSLWGEVNFKLLITKSMGRKQNARPWMRFAYVLTIHCAAIHIFSFDITLHVSDRIRAVLTYMNFKIQTWL